MTKEAILDNITGLVNAASKKLGNDRRYNELNPSVLNALAKIFYKVGSAGKYISLIQNNEETANLLISFPGTPPKMAIKGSAINNLNKSISNLLQTDSSKTQNFIKAKIELFRQMYIAGNDLVIQLFINKFNEISQAKKQGKTPNQQLEAFVTQLKDWHVFSKKSPREQKSLLKSNEFIKAAQANFKFFLTDEDINKIKSLGDNFLFDIFPHDKNIHNGMHVEAKGVAYRISKDTIPNSTYSIGLATKFGDEVGCCGACTLEFQVFQEEQNITVHRTADFPNNFPAGQYRPSLLIKDSANLLKIFITKLLATSQQVEHSSDEQYRYYYGKLCDYEVQELGQADNHAACVAE